VASADASRVFGALPTLLRIDSRRPASWIALAAAAAAGWTLAADGGQFQVAGGLASGGLLALAAIGRLPTGVPGGDRGPWSTLAWLRGCWAALGFIVAGAAAFVAGCPAEGVAACGIATTASLAVAALVVLPPGGPRTPAIAGSLALMTVGVAAAAAAAAATAAGLGPWAEGLVAVTVWGLLVASLAVNPAAASRDWLGGAAAADRHRVAEPMLGIAMATTLAAMAACFFLAPQFAWAYTAIAMGWLVCLTVPPLANAGSGAAGGRLVRSAVGWPRTPGALPRVAANVAQATAVLAWPAFVAAVLAAVGVWQGGGPGMALAWLAGGAALILLTAGLAGGHGETAQAVILALSAGLAVCWSGLPGP